MDYNEFTRQDASDGFTRIRTRIYEDLQGTIRIHKEFLRFTMDYNEFTRHDANDWFTKICTRIYNDLQ